MTRAADLTLTSEVDPAPANLAEVQAFEGVYRANAGRVYAICLRMTADPARAEELTQEAFVRAYDKRASFRGEADVSAWLRRLAINVVLSDRRARGRRFEWERELVEPALAVAPPAGDATVAIDLDGAVQRLPPGARAVFVMHDVEGYTHGEIGELLEISPVTSKTQLHRARKLLREALSQ